MTGHLASDALAASPLGGSSTAAHAIAALFTQTLVICGVIFLVVAVLVTLCLVRFREGNGREASEVDGNKRLEIAWTIAPVLVLVLLLILTARTMSVVDPPPDHDADLTIVAHQWWWEVRYASGAIAANEIHIPVGKRLVLAVESADVVHDFWVPDLARKIDATPGHPVSIWLEADHPGTYLGACAEYCGAEHAWMRILVVADAPDDFAAWENKQQKHAEPPVDLAAARGLQVFRQKTCQNCHDVAGAAAGAHVAPDLTHLAGRTTLGAGVLENSPDNLKKWLVQPSAWKPASHMPDVQLSDGEVSDLVTYFETLR
jgi:cytochrome c oxidase subunit 2